MEDLLQHVQSEHVQTERSHAADPVDLIDGANLAVVPYAPPAAMSSPVPPVAGVGALAELPASAIPQAPPSTTVVPHVGPPILGASLAPVARSRVFINGSKWHAHFRVPIFFSTPRCVQFVIMLYLFVNSRAQLMRSSKNMFDGCIATCSQVGFSGASAQHRPRNRDGASFDARGGCPSD